MSEFVDECRREWKRLRVPDSVANEMAEDLAADLHEAQSEGASAQDVLGSAAFDPVSFAQSWARERGVATPPAPVSWPTGRMALVALVGAAALLVGGLAVALILTSTSRKHSVVPAPTRAAPARAVRAVVLPDVVGLPAVEAVRHLHTLGLFTAVSYEKSKRLRGIVIDENPASSTTVAAHATVALTVGR